MARLEDRQAGEDQVIESYVKGVQIVETTVDGEQCYRFEAPYHDGLTFDRADRATLYADVYFDANGFQEAGTGEFGIPAEVVQAGKDTLAAYMIAHPSRTKDWVASFYGTKPERLDEYVSWVRTRADELRTEARQQAEQ